MSDTAATPLHLILIDGSGFIFRAYHAIPPMNRPDGTQVNAVYGFTNMLARLLKDHVGTHFAVIFDAGRLTFRNRLYPDYKAHRPPAPDDLIPQFALVRQATAAFGVPGIELDDWEADDLIASYAAETRRLGGRCTIVSSDKDLMQLIGDGVDMLDPMKQKPIGAAEVMEKFGVTPDKVIDVQALIGDSVDNVPGVPGIGPKTAALLMAEYGSLDAILAAAQDGMKASKRRDALVEHAEAARMSRTLVELCATVPLPRPVEDLAARDWQPEMLQPFLMEQGFRSIATRLGMDGSKPAARPKPADNADRSAPFGAPAPQPESRAATNPEKAGFGPYQAISTREALTAFLAEATKGGIIAVGVETDGVDAIHAALVGIALAIAPGRAVYLPFGQDLLAGPGLAADETIAALRPLLADPGVLKIFHNAKFDLAVLERAGIPAGTAPLDDTMLISYAQDAGRHGHSVAELSELHLGHTPIGFEGATGTGRARLNFGAVPLEQATAYAAEDADLTLRLWHALRPGLRETKSLSLYELMERRLVPILLAMEQAGVSVDANELRRLSADFSERMAAQEVEIHKLAGRTFNLGSPKQLGEILFDEMKLPGGKRSKTGAWGTDASVLQDLAEQGHELPERLLQWRQLAKLKSTYTDALVEEIDPQTKRVHTRFAMAATTTGRLSSTDPNLQNIPIRTEEGGRIRRAFVSEPGHLLVSADYSQIELRLLAHVADLPVLRESFRNGEDIHARTASEVFGVPMAGMDPLTRRRAKAINFGIIYGISAFGLARQLQIEPGQAKRYIEAYFERYPGIRDYMERTKVEARDNGFVLTPFGRRCWIPGIADKNGARRAYAERQAINAPLQGGGADIIKRAMVKLPAALQEAGLAARMLLQVHDELMFEVPEAESQATAVIIRDVMQNAAELSVPLVVETGIGRSWAEAH
ncbi:DNA polymerase I [Acidisoma cellulosilytica]|uniref:DNA polymerase I n=1 Tax=Acidisoma cellulosilyticum TaxID=2802395 RepID=A0A963Z3F8_9PROT|nr:DNA polymerase I [Acidisoma cellulosilyticum]MCB8881784.1 DNA polymerase I [Acidisoma cellulosilyticum]